MKKNLFQTIGAALLLLSAVSSCEKKMSVAVASVDITQTKVTLAVGESERLVATVYPEDATNKNVFWESSDHTVATVSSNGTVTAVSPGYSIVSVFTEDGEKTDRCRVTVTAEPTVIPVENVILDKTSVSMYVGDCVTLRATVLPENATNKSITWSSSDPTVVSVATNGVLTGLAPGTSEVKVTTKDGGFTAICLVTVRGKNIPVTGVTLDCSSVTLKPGESAELHAAVQPSDATNKEVEWSSSDISIVTVNNGVLTAVKEGKTSVYVKTKDGGFTATCAVTVDAGEIKVTGVALDRDILTLNPGEKATLTAIISPDNASNREVEWSSDNPFVATVTSTGGVSAVKEGTANITVKTKDGGFTATCKVTVKSAVVHVSSVSLDKTSLTLTEGESGTLTAKVSPENATDKSVKWSSTDPNVATVSDGKVTAVKEGSATITVTTVDGGLNASCNVTVKKKTIAVTGVQLNKSSVSLVEGQTETLTATVLPSNATNKDVEWSSDNASVVTVSGGKITAVKEGTTKITVKTKDGGYTASCSVTVTKKTIAVTGVKLDKSSVSLVEGESETLTATVSPSDATNKDVEWSSDNASVASVSGGKITAVKEGTAKITVRTKDGGYTASCTVTVTKKTIAVTGVQLNKTALSLAPGASETLTATVLPSNASNKDVEWSSKDASIATVVNGKVTAVKEGTTKITVKTKDGGFSATCEVTVKSESGNFNGNTNDYEYVNPWN